LLGFDPGGGFGGVDVFEPAIGVSDGSAVEGVGDVGAAGFGVSDRGGLFGDGRHVAGKHGKGYEETVFAHEGHFTLKCEGMQWWAFGDGQWESGG
jgi:hypothetical protein